MLQNSVVTNRFQAIGVNLQVKARYITQAIDCYNNSCLKCVNANRPHDYCENCPIREAYVHNLERKFRYQQFDPDIRKKVEDSLELG